MTGARWPGRIAAAGTGMEPPMYRMVVPVLTVVGSKRLPLWVCEAMPLGGSWLAGRRPSEASGQTEEVPFGWLRAFIVAEARGAACGDLF